MTTLSSYSQPKLNIGGLSNNGAIPKQSNIMSGYTLPNTQNTPPQNSTSNIQQGTNKGMLGVSTPPVVNVGGKSQIMKGSPSVLAQQQALNKLGAGLVEDGIAGELTKAAISKYGSGASTTDTTKTTPKTETPTTPQVGTPTQNAQNVLNTGQQTPQEQQTYSGLINQSQTPSQAYLDAQAEAKRISDQQAATAGDYAQKTNNIAGTAGFLTQQTGLQGLLNNQYNTVQGALANQYAGATNRLGAANTQQGLQVQAGQAANTAAQTQAGRAQTGANTVLSAGLPQYPSYSSQVINPLTGQPMNGTSGNLQDAVANVASKLQDGTMTYNDALQALSGYGQGGINALQQALPPNFNIAQSNTLAGQQGSVQVNYQLADTALKNVESKIQDLMGLQKTNVPFVNSAANWVSTTFGKGSEQTRAMTGAVQSLRNAYGSLLASVKGGTPTDYSSQAAAEIPNEPTPNDIKAIRDNFEVLGKARANILGNPGQSGTSGSTTGGSFAEQW